MKKINFAFTLVILFSFQLVNSVAQNNYHQFQPQKKVTFYANISDFNDWSGHVWVGFYDGNKEVAYGFYNGSFMVNGKIKNEAGRKWDINYTFPVNDIQYDRGLQVLATYNRLYLLGKKDCRHLASHVARAIGLNTPSFGIKSPAEWLADLVDLN